MTTPAILAPNALAAAFPQRAPRQISIRTQYARERWAAYKAKVPASGFRARSPGKVTWHGRAGSHTFEVVRGDALAAPVVLVAVRRFEIVAVEAFEPENAARLRAWIDRAAVAPGIELHVHRATSRAERAAVVADLSPKPVPARVWDRRAIMIAANADARLRREATGESWAACLSAALRGVWEAVRAARTEIH